MIPPVSFSDKRKFVLESGLTLQEFREIVAEMHFIRFNEIGEDF